MFERFVSSRSKIKAFLKRMVIPPISKKLSGNFIPLTDVMRTSVEESLKSYYFTQFPANYLDTEAGKNDLEDHITGRLHQDRERRIPWLDCACSLKGCKVLEIGCGTGTSTVSLAEQGAIVTAIDIDKSSLNVARDRCRIYDLDVEFHQINSVDVADRLNGRKFDIVIFWAALEHMTEDERILAMSRTWDMLDVGGFWCVTDTPNRLFWMDKHTSLIPFFNWLPEGLAMKYARNSPRKLFRESFANSINPSDSIRLSRWGRGVSFHEFELAMMPLEKLKIESSMNSFHSNLSLYRVIKRKLSKDLKYEKFMTKLMPNIHPGFFQPNLDLILSKKN